VYAKYALGPTEDSRRDAGCSTRDARAPRSQCSYNSTLFKML
jgi:hypothetical protein